MCASGNIRVISRGISNSLKLVAKSMQNETVLAEKKNLSMIDSVNLSCSEKMDHYFL